MTRPVLLVDRSPDLPTWLSGAPIRVAGILVLGFVVAWSLHRVIHRVVDLASRRAAQHRADVSATPAASATSDNHRVQRARTMGSLLRSVVDFTVGGIVVLMVLTEIGVSVAPLLASAGIGGVALGFGAQSLVKDFLSGIFMIIEDQYGVGDVIDTGEAIGEVEEVSLRVTRVRDAAGVVWYIRNGEIVRIGNKSQGWAMATIDFPVAYDEDPQRVIRLISEQTEALATDERWEGKLIDPPTVAGVESVSGGTMTIRVFAKCRPGEQHAVQRELRERVKVAFGAAGVRGPLVPGQHPLP